MPGITAQLQAATGLINQYGRSNFHERFFLRPAINADIADTKNKNFEVLGTNGTTALATFPTTSIGGVTLTTATAANDQMILAPHLDTGVSSLATTQLLPSARPGFYVQFKTGSSIADVIIWAGMKLTNVAVGATDADQAFFRYESGVNDGNLTAWVSIAGTDYEVDLGLALAASTYYELFISVDSARKATFGYNVARGYLQTAAYVCPHQMTANAALLPFAGIQTKAAAAKAITITDLAAGRDNA